MKIAEIKTCIVISKDGIEIKMKCKEAWELVIALRQFLIDNGHPKP